MIVVSYSSPLISLAAIGHLNLLRELFGRVLISEAVYLEGVAHGANRPGANEVAAAPWIERHVMAKAVLTELLKKDLDDGEAEAIALALERKADVPLLDEQRGRERAVALGLKVTGVVGLLAEAKRQRRLTEVRPALDALRSDAGFWISDRLALPAGSRNGWRTALAFTLPLTFRPRAHHLSLLPS